MPPVFHHIVYIDRKSTRLNSSHLVISYAVFCLKKKKIIRSQHPPDLTHQLSSHPRPPLCVHARRRRLMRRTMRATHVARPSSVLFFFFNDTATTEIYTLSLHDALPICWSCRCLVPMGPRLGRWPRGL